MKPHGSMQSNAQWKCEMTTAKPELQDTIVAEIHAIRQQLHDKYNGDLHAYSLAATANALALGFKFAESKVPVSAAQRNDTEPVKYDMSDLAGRLSWKGDALAEQRAQRDAW